MKYFLSLLLATIASLGLLALSLSFHLTLWLAELLVSFTPTIVIIGIITLALSFALYTFRAVAHQTQRKSLAYAVVLTVGIIAGLYSLGFSLTAPNTSDLDLDTSSVKIRYATFNKLHTNAQHTEIAQYIIRENIDVVAFQEITSAGLTEISKLAGYEHTFSSQSVHETFGTSVGIMSRKPMTETTTAELGSGYAIIRAQISPVADRPIAFYSAHLPPPFTNTMYEKGLSNIETFGKAVAEDKLPVVAGGDFNTTVFSPKLRIFDQIAGNTVKPTVTRTWPQCSWSGYGSLLCLRIDHIYVSNEIGLRNITISPDLGSDHRMVIAELIL